MQWVRTFYISYLHYIMLKFTKYGQNITRRKPQPWDRCTRLNKIYKFLKTQEGKKIQRNMRWWSARNVPGKPLKLTKSCTCLWLVEEKVAKVLYRIKPYDEGNPFSYHRGAGRPTEKFKLAATARHLPDPDKEAEELPLQDGSTCLGWTRHRGGGHGGQIG